MDIKDFKAGNLVTQKSGYRSFEPSLIDNTYTWSEPELNVLLEEANLKLGELSSFSNLIPNVETFIRMHVIKEATSSSRIEGTQTSMEEALLEDIQIEPERKDDWKEVNNYIKAINHSVERLKELPLSNRLLKEAHAVLLDGTRGEKKYPGEFRKSQNWIGGASLKDAVFIPPHWDSVPLLMSDLEKFIHNEEIAVPHLIKIAIAHYQLETIHPFCDGNGRIGRLMITLYFMNNNIFNKPILYLSDFFERNKGLYYDNLMAVRNKNDLTQWLKFFLVGVIETCKTGTNCFQKIIQLKESLEGDKILKLGKKINTAKGFLNYLYSKPIVNALEVSQNLSMTLSSANSLISDFVALGILKEITGFKRNRLFKFDIYMQLFEREKG